MSLVKNIKKYLDDNFISQKIISSKTEMTDNAVSLVLNEKRKLTADEYISICQALNVPLDTFVTKKQPA